MILTFVINSFNIHAENGTATFTLGESFEIQSMKLINVSSILALGDHTSSQNIPLYAQLSGTGFNSQAYLSGHVNSTNSFCLGNINENRDVNINIVDKPTNIPTTFNIKLFEFISSGPPIPALSVSTAEINGLFDAAYQHLTLTFDVKLSNKSRLTLND